jgi:hypothetical protein
MAIVYRHRRLDINTIFYIGIGVNEKRAFQKRSRNQYWKNITSKTNYNVEIIANLEDYNDAKELEIFLISLYGRKDLGKGILCNMTNGGDGNSNFSDELRNRISNSLKDKKQSDETKLKRKNTLTKTWKNLDLRELKSKQTKELHNSGFYLKYSSLPSKKKGLPFAGDKEKLSNSLKEYYKNNKPHNYITLDESVLKNIEIDCLNNYTENKISKKYNLSRKTIKRIIKENNFNPKRNNKNENIE